MFLNRTVDTVRRFFKHRGGQRRPAEDTEEIPALGVATPGEAKGQVGPSGFQVGLASDPGCVRDHNEDASLAWQCLIAQKGQPPEPMGLFIIADGMGGHARGEQASAFAVQFVASHIIRHVCLPLLDDDQGLTEQAPINEILEDSIRLAHQAVSRRLPEAGTTLTMALVLNGEMYIAHVGDSRAYLGQKGALDCLTQDHSIAARLVEMGQASPEEAAFQRNILYKALGQGPHIEPDILYHKLEKGRYLLLCCDGLWGKVPEAEMAAIIEAAPTPDAACQNLVARANEYGGEDNISVILVARSWPVSAC